MKTSSCKRFTLIELLVVIAIIVILAGLIFPALGSVRNNAKKSKAHSECLSLKTAIIMYETEFSCWPAKTSGSKDTRLSDSDYATMCKYLTCADSSVKNSKNMVFYEVGGDYDSSKGILDPWGNPYKVILDVNYDGKIDNDADEVISPTNNANGRTGSQDLITKVAVYSLGVQSSDKNFGSPSKLAEKKKLVISW